MVSLHETEKLKQARELELAGYQDSDPRLLEDKRSTSLLPAHSVSSVRDQVLQGGDNAYC
jgi:hypothetical protein